MVFLFGLVLVTYLAYVGVFSVSGLLKPVAADSEDQTLNTYLNSQNLNVLQPAVHSDPNPAKGGGDILVVDDQALMAQVGVTGEAPSLDSVGSGKNISVYEVRPGDTLSQIADMFGVSVNTIRWANDFEGSIQPGQRLTILPVTGVQYTVQSGGTITDVVKKYVEDSEEIESLTREVALFNGLDLNAELDAGDTLIIPNIDIAHIEKKDDSKTDSGSKSSGSTSSGVAVGTKASVSTASGWLVHPVPGGIKTQGIHGYNSIDIGAPIGTPIRAAAAGRVIISKEAGWNGGYGKYVVIKHDNGVQTLYAHNSANFVAVGEWVEQGAQIANVGSTGNSTGPHTHFEVRGATNPF